MTDIKISESTRIGEQNALIAFYQQRSQVLAQLVVNASQERELLTGRIQELEAAQKLDREEIENLRVELAEKDA
jgi:hypothetical protein